MFIGLVGAIVSSWIVYDEKVVLSIIIGCFLSLISVLLFNTKRNLKKLEFQIRRFL